MPLSPASFPFNMHLAISAQYTYHCQLPTPAGSAKSGHTFTATMALTATGQAESYDDVLWQCRFSKPLDPDASLHDIHTSEFWLYLKRNNALRTIDAELEWLPQTLPATLSSRIYDMHVPTYASLGTQLSRYNETSLQFTKEHYHAVLQDITETALGDDLCSGSYQAPMSSILHAAIVMLHPKARDTFTKREIHKHLSHCMHRWHEAKQSRRQVAQTAQ